ncbi:MAG: Gfo/Idh/MocA family oxidoreductase [Bacteroidales bacterium]|nr:Gfo/Idh/MocA family oxidoreductase [Bacteroidales bacterium]
MNKNICVVGAGRWGQNHIRTLAQMNCLAAIVEENQNKIKELASLYPQVYFCKNLEEAIENRYDAYVVATPAETHYRIGKALLQKGLHVLIEKPMTLYSKESQELVDIASQTGSTLMVGHVLIFHPAIRKIKELLIDGKIGQLYYVYSTRLNLGTVRTEENVFWSFAPHDVSILDYLIGSSPIRKQAKGAKFLQDKIFDVTMTQFEFPNNIHAHIHVSWLHPFKEQRLVLVGSKGMISFDDSSVEKEIHFYNKRIDFVKGVPVKVEQPDEIIPYEKKSPLTEELTYFIENLGKKPKLANGESGYKVVKVLEEVQEMITSY